MIVSDNVGWGCTVNARSFAVAPISTASTPLLGTFVHKQNPAGDIANRINGRVGRLLLLVDFNKSFVIESPFCVLQTQVLGIRSPANCDEVFFIDFLLFLPADFEFYFDL